jgi:membrane protease YdiL (CAAX protease family)
VNHYFEELIMLADKKEFSLPIFLIIIFGLTWSVEYVIFRWASHLIPPILGAAPRGLLAALSAFICGFLVFRDGFTGAGWRIGEFKYYILVILFALALWIPPWILDINLGYSSMPHRGILVDWAFLAGWSAPILALAALGAELAWRGYLLPRLARSRSPEGAALVHSLIWWVWRLPLFAAVYIMEGRDLALLSGLPPAFTIPWVIGVAALAALMHGVIYAYFWVRSGSIIVVSLYHLLYAGLRDTMWLTMGFGYITQWWGLVIVSLVGAYLIWRGDWTPLRKIAGHGSDPIAHPNNYTSAHN